MWPCKYVTTFFGSGYDGCDNDVVMSCDRGRNAERFGGGPEVTGTAVGTHGVVCSEPRTIISMERRVAGHIWSPGWTERRNK